MSEELHSITDAEVEADYKRAERDQRRAEAIKKIQEAQAELESIAVVEKNERPPTNDEIKQQEALKNMPRLYFSATSFKPKPRRGGNAVYGEPVEVVIDTVENAGKLSQDVLAKVAQYLQALQAAQAQRQQFLDQNRIIPVGQMTPEQLKQLEAIMPQAAEQAKGRLIVARD